MLILDTVIYLLYVPLSFKLLVTNINESYTVCYIAHCFVINPASVKYSWPYMYAYGNT